MSNGQTVDGTAAQLDNIVAAINALSRDDLERRSAWGGLDALSSNTRFEEIDAAPDSVVIHADGTFEARAAVYISLIFGPRDDAESMSDEYAASITGRLVAGHVDIDAIRIDTSTFGDPDR